MRSTSSMLIFDLSEVNFRLLLSGISDSTSTKISKFVHSASVVHKNHTVDSLQLHSKLILPLRSLVVHASHFQRHAYTSVKETLVKVERPNLLSRAFLRAQVHCLPLFQPLNRMSRYMNELVNMNSSRELCASYFESVFQLF